jgi:hypothetical protein
MKDVPPKLLKKLAHLEAGALQKQIERYGVFLEMAEKNKFQSPRFWAMRQVLSERNDEEVKRVVLRRLKGLPE